MEAPARRSEIVRGKRGVTADTAARLAKVFGTTTEFWLNLQNAYDIRTLETTVNNDIESLEPYTFPEEAFA